MSAVARWWPVGPLLLLLAAGEWLAHPTTGGAALVAVLAAATAAALMSRRRVASRALLVSVLLAGSGTLLAQYRVHRVTDRWPEERERRITAASRRLAGDLDLAFNRVEALSERARGVASLPRPGAFAALAAMVPPGGPEVGVVVLDPSGVPVAWAGSHHRIPEPEGPGLSSRVDGYYLLLQSRRGAAGGRVAVASALVWAHPAAPGEGRGIAAEFRQRTGVGLVVYAPGAAPDDPDVFDYDYEDPSAAGGRRQLFSVRLEPPEQSAALSAAVAGARGPIAGLLVAVFLLALVAAPPPARVGLAILAPWLVYRATGAAAPGRLLLAAVVGGAVLAVLAAALSQRRPAPRKLAGALLFLAAAPAVALLGRSLPTPGALGGGGAWLAWHLALALPAMGLLLTGAELCTRSERRGAVRWASASILLSAIALWLGAAGWQPTATNPVPAPAIVAWAAAVAVLGLPAGRLARIVAVAAAGGTGAGLLTWAAVQEDRIVLAGEDIAGLGVSTEMRPAPALAPAIEAMARPPEPRSATELFVRWQAVALSDSGYPAVLALHDSSGAEVTKVAIDSLDLPTELLANVATSAGDRPGILRVARSPGVHDLGAVRLGSGLTLIVALGPRSQLVGRTRLGGLIAPPPSALPYRLVLGPPRPGPAGGPEQLAWLRQGWTVRAERDVSLPEGARTVQAVIALRSPGAVAVRLALMLVIDAALLAGLWWLAGLAARGPLRWPDWSRARRSFRLRLAVALAAFFLVPALGFTAWGLARLRAEGNRVRDRELLDVLRQASVPAARLLRGTDEGLAPGLGELSTRIGGELALYSGGALLVTSAPILRDLGVIQPLLDPAAFTSLGLEGGLDLVREANGHHADTRIGYRVVQAGPPSGVGVLAAPLRSDVAGGGSELEDLALALVLAGLLGAAAAAAGARLAARALARPVAELRHAALAIGSGGAPPPPARLPPAEFEPVFGAMRRMAADVQATQAELESARARTAAVLATVATGVVALDVDGRVLLANPRAGELLGRALPEGEDFGAGLPAAWEPVRDAIAATRSGGEPGEAEFEAGGRRLTLHAARLQGGPGGLVLAFNDVTQASRAARVLAWGEMARQVAHEIKNPLTPLRLGVQHLQRAWRRGPAGFGDTLDETGGRILGEIDRLDTIARIFSRFGEPLEDAGPLESVDLAAAAVEVVQLYSLAEDGARVRLKARGRVTQPARRDEVKEVLVNLLENARNAEASEVVIEVGPGELIVRDDGRGIPAADLGRVFEPRFSTTTSGAGLGLAIVRRLAEGWGATVRLESGPGRGTLVRVTWPAAESGRE